MLRNIVDDFDTLTSYENFQRRTQALNGIYQDVRFYFRENLTGSYLKRT